MNTDKFTTNGKFLMLALDHRGSFKKLMNPENPGIVSDQDVVNLKMEIIKSLENQFSGLLIDVEYGLPAYINKTKPFLLPVEKTGYSDLGGERITELQRSVTDLKNLGASGAKLLLYFNPFLQSAVKQLETSKKVLDECKAQNSPLFLEIVTYETEGKEEQREKLVLGSVNMFLNADVVPDVFKLEYPGSLEACQKITHLVGNTPWILLTRGDSFDHFKTQLQDTTRAGAVGFLAGRALWQEVCKLQGREKETFLKKTLPQRFRILVDIVTNTH